MKSRLAIWSFILSLFPFLLLILSLLESLFKSIIPIIGRFFWYGVSISPITIILSIILAIISLRKIKEYNLEGRGFAITSIIINIIFALIVAFTFLLLSGME